MGDLANLEWLNLYDNPLTGTIPTQLGNATSLKGIWLANWSAKGQLTGSIPTQLGNLTSLEYLDLGNNQLTGSIPPELGNLTNLRTLNLPWNQLTGSIPTQLGSLANLERLWLNDNQLTGTIPAQLGNLTSLRALSLYSNSLSGTIPPELGNLANLQHLRLSGNQLTGTIPAQLGNVTSLQDLILHGNQLSGSVPPELGNLTNLERLWLDGNQLTGSIPVQLGSLANLQQLQLSYNQLTGGVPAELGSLANLQRLYLHNNQLTGSIPAELGALSKLQHLDLQNNQLSGPLPARLSRLTRLIILKLYGNQLSGPIPQWLSGMSQLEFLGLGANQFTGPIPSALGGLANLRLLDLGANPLSPGPIPSRFRELSNLSALYIYNAHRTGSIPSWIGDLTNLQTLSLGNNQLTGSIPPEIGNLTQLKILHLAWNTLSGRLPTQLGMLTSLELLSVSDNQLTQAIPTQVGRLTNLKRLQAWNNRFTAPLPTQLGNLSLLEELKIQGHTITGNIPTQLGNLSALKKAHLSYGEFSGPIPTQLSGLTNLEELHLDQNNLTGCIPRTLASHANYASFVISSQKGSNPPLAVCTAPTTPTTPTTPETCVTGAACSCPRITKTWTVGSHSCSGAISSDPVENVWNVFLKISDNEGNEDGELDITLEDRDWFGSETSFSEDGMLLAVGAHGDADNGDGTHSSTGAVYIFEKGVGDTWQRVHKISNHTASTVPAVRFTATQTDVDLDGGAAFGKYVSLSGNLLAVGAPWSNDSGSNRGAVYLFERDGRKWKQVHKFSDHGGTGAQRFTAEKTDISLDDNDQFGYSVSLSGNLLAVGSRWDDDGDTDYGAIYLFEKQVSGRWNRVHKFSKHTASSADADRFTTEKTYVDVKNKRDDLAHVISLSGTVLAMSLPGYDGDVAGSNKGAVYLFAKQPDDTWNQVHKFSDHTTLTTTADRFTAAETDVDLDNGDSFGSAAYLSGDLLAIGAPLDDDGGTNAGAVYLFEKQQGGGWRQKHKYSNHTSSPSSAARFTTMKTDINVIKNDQFGRSVSISGNLLATGTSNARDEDIAVDISDPSRGTERGAVFLVESRAGTTTNTVSGKVGSAEFVCSSGAWSPRPKAGATCNALSSCLGAPVTWSVLGASCNGQLTTTNSGASYTVTDASGSSRGSATYACVNGVWGRPDPITCARTACEGKAVTWSQGGASCGGQLTTTNNGLSYTVTDSSGNSRGYATYACANGIWGSTPTATLCGETIKISDNDGDAAGEVNIDLDDGDGFGYGASLSADGTLMAVGARYDDDGNIHNRPDKGAVYLFEKTGGVWSRIHKFSDHIIGGTNTQRFTTAATDINLDHSDRFGTAVSLSGDGTLLAVGASWDDDGGHSNGAVYLFEKSGNRWRQAHKFSNHTNSGVSGTRFTSTQTDVDLGNNDQFGHAVSLSGNLLAVGVRFDDDGGTNRGAVYLFEKSGSRWRQTHKFSDHTIHDVTATRFTATETDVNLDNNDRFGTAISLSSNLLAVGVRLDDDGGSVGNSNADRGAVYLFKKTGSTWSQEHKFSDHTTSDVTATRSTDTQTDVNLDDGDVFGYAVSLSGNLLAVGAVGGSDGGGVYLFKKTGNKWSRVHKYSDHTTSTVMVTRFTGTQTDVELDSGDNFGKSVSLISNLLAVGASSDGDGGGGRGAVYIFSRE